MDGGRGGGGVRVREPSLFTCTPSVCALHLIKRCISPETSGVVLNLAPHPPPKFCHCTWANLRFSWACLYGLPTVGPNILTIPHQISNSHLEILPNLDSCFIYQCFSRDCEIELPPRTSSYIYQQLEQWTTLELQVWCQ